MEYKDEMFLYVFLFQDFSKYSMLRKIFLFMVNKETVSFYGVNQCAILSNKKFSFYDNKNENVIIDGKIIEYDELGGNLKCGIIIDQEDIVGNI